MQSKGYINYETKFNENKKIGTTFRFFVHFDLTRSPWDLVPFTLINISTVNFFLQKKKIIYDFFKCNAIYYKSSSFLLPLTCF